MRYLPGRFVMMLFAVLSIAFALLATTSMARDKALFLFTFPLFVFAALLGTWQSGRWNQLSESNQSDE